MWFFLGGSFACALLVFVFALCRVAACADRAADEAMPFEVTEVEAARRRDLWV
jgi:hypothetical protein